MLTANMRVPSDSVFCTGPCSVDANKRNDIAGQLIDIEWQVFPGDTSVRTLHKPPLFMSETGHKLDKFPDSMKNASMFNDNTKWEPKGAKHMSSFMKQILTQQNSDIVIGVVLAQVQRNFGNTTKSEHLTNPHTEDETISLSGWGK